MRNQFDEQIVNLTRLLFDSCSTRKLFTVLDPWNGTKARNRAPPLRQTLDIRQNLLTSFQTIPFYSPFLYTHNVVLMSL